MTTKFHNGFYLYYITGPEGFPASGTAQDFEDEWAEVALDHSSNSKGRRYSFRAIVLSIVIRDERDGASSCWQY